MMRAPLRVLVRIFPLQSHAPIIRASPLSTREAARSDGAINVRFHQIQYAPITQVVMAVFFVIPLPSSVTVSGEVVKLRR